MRDTLKYGMMAMALTAMASCGNYEKPAVSATSGTTTMFCDNSFENVMEQEIDVFEYIYPEAHVLCRYGTAAEALDSLMSLNTPTIVIPRDLTDAEKERMKKKRRNLRSEQIAVDAMALIVNEDNPATKLSLKEVKEILTGDTKSWLDLNPNYPDKPIAILFDNAGSSLYRYMRDSLCAGEPLGKNVYAQGSVQGVVDAVKKDKSAIGVIGVSWLTTDLHTAIREEGDTVPPNELARQFAQEDTAHVDMPAIMAENDARLNASGVKVLALMRNDNPQAYKPYQQNIYDGTYPLTRRIYMITTCYPSTPGGGFFSFVTGIKGQSLILKTGVMPKRFRQQVIELMP